MTFLESELRRAAEGACSCVLLVGEPGVGKTRLTAEFLARQSEGILRLSARAYPLGATAAFGLWAEALEHHLRGRPSEEIVRVCGGVLDDLAPLLRSVAALRGSVPDGEPSRLRLLDGLAVVLANLSDDGPVVVALDDVHLADASSWEALQYLAHDLHDAPLLVVAAARPAELAEHEVAGRVLFSLEQEGFLTRLDLHPLDPAALGELTQALLGRAPPPALVDWLNERCRGNPLFTIGLLRALEVEGADLSHPRLRRLPEGLAERVGERLKGLEAPARSTLEVLATLGRRVEFGELVATSGAPPDELAWTLEGLTRRRCVLEDEQGLELIYEVAHPLIAEAVYQAIGRARRRPLHRRIGRALAAAGNLGEAAPHFAASAEPGEVEAVEVLADALRQAEGRGAYREALTILGAVVDVLPSGDTRWLKVAEAMSWGAEWVVDHRGDVHAELGIKAMQAIDAALEGSPDLAQRAAVKFRLGSFLFWGAGLLDEAAAVCLEAQELFEAAGDHQQALLARLELAFLAGFKGDMPAWRSAARLVADAADTAGDRLALMHGVGRGIAFGAFFTGRFDEAEDGFRRGLAIAVEDDKPYFQTLALAGVAFTLAMAGQIDEALLAMNEAKAVNPNWRDHNLLEWQTLVYWLAGDFAAAVEAAEESAVWNPAGLSRRRGLGMSFAVLCAVETAHIAEARRYLARGYAAYGELDLFFLRPYCTYAEAMIGWREGNAAQPVEALREAASRTLATGCQAFAVFPLLDLAEVAAESDRPATAQEAADQLEQLSGVLDRDLYRALAALGQAWAAVAQAAPIRAAAPARTAVELLAPTGYRAFSGRALEVLGRALVDSDRAGAVAAFEQAAATFDACGATWRRDRALESLRQLGSRGRRRAAAVTGRASLTGREQQVARLAAQGHTVRQIAERLCISQRTVEGHLANVYAKLGVASKSDLVGRAFELDM